MKKIFYIHTFLLLLISVFNPLILEGQEGSFKIISGVGIPEFMHAGLQYETRVNQFGLSAGYMPGVSESLISVNAHVFFHFKRREDGTLNRWYLKTGLTYTREESKTRILRNTLLGISAGKMIPLGQSSGFNINLGIAFVTSESEKRKTPKPPSSFNLDIEVPFVPALAIVFYMKI